MTKINNIFHHLYAGKENVHVGFRKVIENKMTYRQLPLIFSWECCLRIITHIRNYYFFKHFPRLTSNLFKSASA